ncbi:hypothetical protein ISF_08997 [Cordyceps fumosorosea ARSEF 2679]|uniref:3-keto-alpha-glucoside-1,2-lyase/3-keto-2-hydroxy-glucal hydratase domain-containing protein n=1 Tax=Cordyceps fumosorosea (strain ARSEF 2679) TaxID=1081104 RepID=A0A167LJE8_CORFA|nr:hypothetical protein ISF_08997 [Cordyceps fumosorosea ARSEF 2679]OAA53156.1 hypothetical protein ISF_08997 [Cordyceps fumosorosea ARSEF 2679]
MGAQFGSLAFLKGGEFFMDSANIVDLYYPNVSKAFTKPVSTASVHIHGFDWMQAFPGKPFEGDGHGVHLAVAQEMMMNESVVQHSSTVLTSLTFSTPEALMVNGYPAPMHDSWHICRHIFISTTPSVKKAADNGKGCDSLPDKYFDRTVLMDKTLGLLHTSANQQKDSWRIGTGYHSPGDAGPFATAAERTYLVATVWGYSATADPKSIKLPEVSFACLSSGKAYVPSSQPPPSTSTTTTTTFTTTTPTGTPTQTAIQSDAAYYDDFTNGMVQWTVYDGSYIVDSNALTAASSGGGKVLLHSSYADFSFETDLTLPSGSGDVGFLFRISNPGKGPDTYDGYYAGVSTSGSVMITKMAGSWHGLGTGTTNWQADKVHRLKVRAVGPALSFFVDDMRVPKLSVQDDAFRAGMDGFRVNGVSAKFDNVQILPLRFVDDFSSRNTNQWTVYDGSFDAKYAVAIANGSDACKALISDQLFSDFSYESDLSLGSGGGNAGLMFRASSPHAGADGYYGYYAGIGDGFAVVGRSDNSWNELQRVTLPGFDAKQRHRIKVQAKGSQISFFVDDLLVPKIQIHDTIYHSGRNGVRTYQIMGVFDNIEIYTM